jgi:cytochrome P450
VNLIGNGMLALLRNPDQLALLREHPELIQPAVEEFLRYESSSQMTGRIAHEDVEYGGKLIRRGDQINLLMGSANHDPAQFANPDRLDITRKDNKHIAFGHGIHYCLGAPLARLEAQIVFTRLAERFAAIEPAGPIPPFNTTFLRGVPSLPVCVTNP